MLRNVSPNPELLMVTIRILEICVSLLLVFHQSLNPVLSSKLGDAYGVQSVDVKKKVLINQNALQQQQLGID